MVFAAQSTALGDHRASAIGIAFFTVALQRDCVTLVTAITFAFEVVVPSLIGIVAFGDAVGTGHMPHAIAGFVLAIGGTVSLSHLPSDLALARHSQAAAAAPASASPLSRWTVHSSIATAPRLR
jgi:hypothetical protein